MADRVITAEAIISAKDNTGDVFAWLGRKMQDVGKGARSSAEVSKLTQSLDAAAKQLAALDKVQSRMSGFAKARGAFNEQKTALEQHARAMRGMDAPTKAMESRYRQLQSSVSSANTALEKQKVALLDAKRAAEVFGNPMGRIASEQKRLKGVIDSTTLSLERQARAGAGSVAVAARAARRGGGHSGHGDMGALGLVGLGIAHGAGHFAHRVAETYGEFDKEERYARVVMGLDRAGMQPLVHQAIQGAGSSRFNDIQWLESQRGPRLQPRAGDGLRAGRGAARPSLRRQHAGGCEAS